MADTIAVTFELDFKTATALDDQTIRTRVERLIWRTARPAADADELKRLFTAMDALSNEARRRGLTDEILQEELATYNAERRYRMPPAA